MLRKLAVLLFLLAFAASCASDKGKKIPPETYFKQGEKLYTEKDYEEAAEKWRKVKESNTSPLLKTIVELRIADALYNDENYIEAAAEYENFRKLHPKHPKAAYALYMLGLSNFKQVEKIDIDQTPVNSAANLFETFLQEYPNNDLTKKVREKLAECRTKQAAYEIYIGKFYYRTDKYVSAIGRLKDAIDKYPGAPVNDEALYILGNAYLQTGEKAKADAALTRLVKDYPKSEFTDKARKILNSNS